MQTFLQGNPTINALVASILTVAVLLTSYFFFEPLVAHGITDTFTVQQQITSEISWRTLANDVTMTPSLPGLSSGNSFGTTTVAVNTNNPTGYNMTIRFATTTAMQGENITSDIPNYISNGGVNVPDFDWTLSANEAGFGYTVIGNTTPADIDQSFKSNGTDTCNTSTNTIVGTCWYNQTDASSTMQIINRTTATPGTGATSTIVFQVGIMSNPSPAIQTGFYNATATLTAVTNP